MNRPTPAHHDTLFLSPQDIAAIVARHGMATTLRGLARREAQAGYQRRCQEQSCRLISTGAYILIPITGSII